MKNRYKISKSKQITYLYRVEKICKLSSEQLAAVFHVSGRTYRDWRRAKFLLPVDAVHTIEKLWNIPFPSTKPQALHAWEKQKSEISKQGARAMLLKYGGFGTPEGRRLGGIRGMATLRKLHKAPALKIFFWPPKSAELAEFTGIMLGDGHVGEGQWSITLNAVKDKTYARFCRTLVTKLFHFQPSILYRASCHVLVIGSGGKNFIRYLRSIGLTATNKVKEQIGIPKWISTSKSYSISCLRGMMDTDGGIFVHTYRVNGKKYSYRKLAFVNRSVPLLQFAYMTLKTLGFTPRLIDRVENKRVWLYNQHEVKQYIESIGTHNPRLLTSNGG
jgi:hypothetical protein